MRDMWLWKFTFKKYGMTKICLEKNRKLLFDLNLDSTQGSILGPLLFIISLIFEIRYLIKSSTVYIENNLEVTASKQISIDWTSIWVNLLKCIFSWNGNLIRICDIEGLNQG